MALLTKRPGRRLACLPASLSLLCVLASASLTIGCADADDGPKEIWAEALQLDGVSPLVVLPGTTLTIHGQGFVGALLGTSRVRIRAAFTPDAGGRLDVDAMLLVDVISDHELSLPLDGPTYAQLCPNSPGELVGSLQLEVASAATGKVHTTPPIGAGLLCRSSLTPTLVSIDGGSYNLNASITVLADSVLLGGDEGQTSILVSGCFLRQGRAAPCETNGEPFTERRLPLVVTDPAERRDGTMAMAPDIVGLYPGTLEATIGLVNVHADSSETLSDSKPWTVSVLPSWLDSVEQEGSSLGGYVDFLGAGFVGGALDESTEFLLQGTFQPDGGGQALALDLILIAGFDSGERVRYVLDEHDSLGALVNLRTQAGTVSGSFTPRFAKALDTITGSPVTASFRIEPVHQLVYVNFTEGFTDALELFGLRAADAHVRDRIVAKAAWIYRGLHVSFRQEVPRDYLLYAQVDITGFDPNGLDLMGYDNTPGKDVGNLRLYDRIGGLNAAQQEDGYPGFGGVFVTSFMGFSTRPPKAAGVAPLQGADPLFDDTFDRFRPDGGDPVTNAELVGFTPLTDGSDCPAAKGDRVQALRCAVFVLGNLLGGTMAHELGHSLGLADPGGALFHNNTDEPYRLMDAGGNRPLIERAELDGGQAEVFCRQNFDYLVSILPSSDPDPLDYRASCY